MTHGGAGRLGRGRRAVLQHRCGHREERRGAEGITPLPRDIFTSDDFYVDRELWRDPRYCRCNSTLALDSQWGDYSSAPKYIKDDPATGAWGHCDVDYAREHIVSPYPFTRGRRARHPYSFEQEFKKLAHELTAFRKKTERIFEKWKPGLPNTSR